MLHAEGGDRCFSGMGAGGEVQVVACGVEGERAGNFRIQREMLRGRSEGAGFFVECHRGECGTQLVGYDKKFSRRMERDVDGAAAGCEGDAARDSWDAV